MYNALSTCTSNAEAFHLKQMSLNFLYKVLLMMQLALLLLLLRLELQMRRCWLIILLLNRFAPCTGPKHSNASCQDRATRVRSSIVLDIPCQLCQGLPAVSR